MLSNQKILEVAMAQSAADLCCRAEDFLKNEPVVVLAGPEPGPLARAYYEAPIPLNLVSYGNNVVASAQAAYRQIAADYVARSPWYSCFETPAIHELGAQLAPLGQQVCYMAEYFLPDAEKVRPLPCPYPTRLLTQAGFPALYTPQWSNALCAKRKPLDVLAVGAYDGEALVGLAGCSADCGTMWQIGIDVLPAYRRRGIAAALVSRLALEILDRNKVPFYCAAWSNLPSVRTALKSGFRPGWVEMTAKPE